MIIIIMGVTGVGKTTIGRMLSEKLDIPFFDADDFHTIDNIQKMKSGIALTDHDRKPWLEHLNKKIKGWSETGAILACSALKDNYREILMKGNPDILWVYLAGSKNLIASRIRGRSGHYMPVDLLDSQFDDLEEPTYGIRVEIERQPGNIVNQILKQL